MAWTPDEIISATGGTVLQEGMRRIFGEIVTDSGKVTRSSVFVALKGERFDGHRFIGDASRRGAGCIVAHQDLTLRRYPEVTAIKVPDTLRALGDLAHYRRRKFLPKVLAITGSNGKTTTKEMVAAIIERASWQGKPLHGRVLKTEGNYNNLVGLPLTLLRLRPKHKVAIVELGTNRPGEIERLTQIAEPDIGLITGIAPAHLSGLKSIAGVAREKGELFRGVNRNGVIIVNSEDSRVRRLAAKSHGRKISYGKRGNVRAESCKLLGAGGMELALRVGKQRRRVELALCGKHNVINAVAAAAMARGFGASLTAICRGLAAVKPFPMRMQVERYKGIGIINDAYNANPASMKAALEALADMPCRGDRIAILGDMFELGEKSKQQHLELGREAARSGIDRLYLLGARAVQVKEGALRGGMRPDKIVVGKNHRSLAKLVRSQMNKGDWLLFKGSRGMRMEKILAEIKN